MRCAVIDCNTDYQSKNFTNDLMFFRFPKDENLRKEWVHACKRGDKLNVENARICSKHFHENCYERNLRFELLGYSARNRRLLKHDALPTLYLRKENAGESSSNKNREDRLDKRRLTKFSGNILQASAYSEQHTGRVVEGVDACSMDNDDFTETNIIVVNDNIELKRDIGTNTDIEERDDIIIKLKKENEALRNENTIFRKFFAPDAQL